jgi:hypothetical protein
MLVFVICSFYLHIKHTMHILHISLEPIFQPSYAARDEPYHSLPTMSKDILQVMMPDVKIK